MSELQKFDPITLTKAKSTANELTKFVKDNDLSVNIAGKNYLMVEGWQFLGMLNGLTEVIASCEKEEGEEVKYKAVAEIVNQHGTVISRGFAWCSKKERKKSTFEEYAIASMAQTRSIGKAYRNILSWIVKLGGYESMPAEEADKETLEKDLSKLKQQVVKKMKEAGLSDSQAMIRQIESVIGKSVIDTADEAQQILDSLEEE